MKKIWLSYALIAIALMIAPFAVRWSIGDVLRLAHPAQVGQRLRSVRYDPAGVRAPARSW